MTTTSGSQIKFSPSELKTIESLQFGLFNPRDIEKFSVCKVYSDKAFDEKGPVEGGLNDQRMGSCEKAYPCKTCQCNYEDCPGHFGHIELASPVYHIGFMDEILRILHCVCSNCSQLLLDKKQKYEEVCKIKNKKLRRTKIYNLCKSIKVCKQHKRDEKDTRELSSTGTMETNINEYNNLNNSDNNLNNNNFDTKIDSLIHDGCGSAVPKYRRDPDNFMKILKDSKDEFNMEDADGRQMEEERASELTAEKCLSIFRKISDEDCELLGFDVNYARPDWMIITKLLVCPPQCRPSVAVDSSLRSQDDLTYAYTQIIKINNDLANKISKGSVPSMISSEINTLQFLVSTLFKNENPNGKAQQRSGGKPIKSISARLKGKEGRLRGNLMGKRVDYSARSVISPDPNLDVDELGVPKSVAKNLTFPEVVNAMNIDRLKKLIENGPDNWPGAKLVIRNDGRRIDLRYSRDRTDLNLDIGDIVERHTCNGDYVIFNRQPSLHKMSMMGHRVHVLPYSTFRLNLSVTTPYNADFDGDEMNMHVPQSFETRSEIMNIMHVPKQIVSPQSNRPVMGIVQDTLIGIMLFTKRDTFITLSQMMNLILWIKDFSGEIPIPAVLKPQPLWTGKQIFSLILPQVNYVRNRQKKKELDEKLNLADNVVQIFNGDLIQGIVCKKTVGNTSGGLIHLIWNEFGPDKTIEFLANCQKIVNNWQLLYGWTVGISDIISDEKTNQDVRNEIKKRKKEVKKLLFQAQTGELECQPGKGMIDSFESKANTTLNNARENAGKFVQESLINSNHLKNMVSAGSKGNATNISQIIACVGQQNVEGKRIAFNFGGRTLPHFVKDDYGPESKGFVENSYLSGLSPTEFFFHAMAGREGIIDTAIKTSKTGYIQRRLVKSLEDVMVQYDGTIRNSTGNIIEFLYGEDGMAGEFIEDQEIQTLNMKDSDMLKKFKFFDEDLRREDLYEKMITFMEPSEVSKVLDSKDFPAIKLSLDNEYKQIINDRNEIRETRFTELEDKIHIPVNIPRIIWNAKSNFKINQFSKSNLNPMVVMSKVKELKEKLIMVRGKDNLSKEAQNNALKLFSILLNYNLCCKNLIERERLNGEALDWILGEIESRFIQAKVQPGESVGSIAAQSIGEPATQMTLNTFHFAGVSAKNVTLGVPRLEEVINVAKKLKTPSMTIYLNPAIAGEEREAQKIHGKLEYTTLADITTSSEIYYDPDLFNTVVAKDTETMNLHIGFYKYEMEEQKESISPWLLRIELDGKLMIEKNLKMEKLEEIITSKYENLFLVRSQENDEDKKLLIRLRYNADNMPKDKIDKILGLEATQQVEHRLMTELNLLGVPNIKKVYAKNEVKKQFNESTGAVDNSNHEWIIETDGTNMAEVFLEEEIDFKRSSSNDVNEIFDVLGIEATRNALIREVRTVLKPYGIYVNFRHIAVLCDTMTQRGFLTSITRHGLSKSQQGPIRNCSFEQTVDVLLEAGMYGQRDNLCGVSENILLGQLTHLGTGAFDLYLDSEALMNSKIPQENKNFIEGDEKLLISPMNNYNNNDFSNNPNATPYAVLTPKNTGRANNLSFSVYGNNAANFTPGYTQNTTSPYGTYQQNSIYKGDSNFISTPNPNSVLAPSSPVFNPGSDYYKTPRPYSPLPFEENKINSEYGQSAYSPVARSPGMQGGGSVYTSNYNKNNNIHNVNTPKSIYSPIGTGMRPNSNSPQFLQGSGIYSSSPRMEGMNSQYSPASSAYNPMSPSYNVMQSVYSRASPYYNPNIRMPEVKEENENDENEDNENDKKNNENIKGENKDN